MADLPNFTIVNSQSHVDSAGFVALLFLVPQASNLIEAL